MQWLIWSEHRRRESVKMGADGTPTKKIDQIAEDIVVDYFTHRPFCQRLISEELGCVDMNGERGTIFLDPIDGTYNAIAGIPFYALSIAYAEGGGHPERICQKPRHGRDVPCHPGPGGLP
ncbi:MAG: inositol monophosphatase family protein [Methanoculleus sp.]